jgi:hypothetical protein
LLKEILGVMQDDPASERRWFHDDYFDLYTRETSGQLVAFELCYGIHAYERALAWIQGRGFFHDGGTSPEGDFIGALLSLGDPLEVDPIIARFQVAAAGLPGLLRGAVETRLREYALQNAEGFARRSRFRRAPWQQGGGPQDDPDETP